MTQTSLWLERKGAALLAKPAVGLAGEEGGRKMDTISVWLFRVLLLGVVASGLLPQLCQKRFQGELRMLVGWLIALYTLLPVPAIVGELQRAQSALKETMGREGEALQAQDAYGMAYVKYFQEALQSAVLRFGVERGLALGGVRAQLQYEDGEVQIVSIELIVTGECDAAKAKALIADAFFIPEERIFVYRAGGGLGAAERRNGVCRRSERNCLTARCLGASESGSLG